MSVESRSNAMTSFHEGEEFFTYKDTSDEIGVDGKRGLLTWGKGWCIERRPADADERAAIRRITGLEKIPFDDPIALGRFLDHLKQIQKIEVSAFMHRSYLEKILPQVETEINFWPDLDDNRAAAIVDLAYNMGLYGNASKQTGLLSFKDTLTFMARHQWEDAARALLDSAYARSLPTRAKRISRVIATGEWPPEIPEPKD